jgi:hypothetical protein
MLSRSDTSVLRIKPATLIGFLGGAARRDDGRRRNAHRVVDLVPLRRAGRSPSESAARLVTMESVHANVTTKAELYEHEARVRRQEDVTTELLDIVVGAESVLQRPTIH